MPTYIGSTATTEVDASEVTPTEPIPVWLLPIAVIGIGFVVVMMVSMK